MAATTVKPSAHKNPARHQFNCFMQGAEKHGYLVKGQERLCYSLLAALASGDDVAELALTDLYLEHGMEAKAQRLPRVKEHLRECISEWSVQQKSAFYRLCKKHGVFAK